SPAPSSNRRRIASPPADPPGSRVARAGIRARPSAATSNPTCVDLPAPSPPSTVMNLPRMSATSAPAAPDQIPRQRADSADGVHAVDPRPGNERRLDWHHVRSGDGDLPDRLPFSDGGWDRAVVLDRDLHILA